MTELVMLDMAAGPGFVHALERVWAAGDAVLSLSISGCREPRQAE